MKKPTLHVGQQPAPRNPAGLMSRLPTANGYAMVVDGHFKTQFAEETSARKDAAELLAKIPMLKIEIYDASSKARTRMK